MKNVIFIVLWLTLVVSALHAQESDDQAKPDDASKAEASRKGQGPRTMSGMSILGNEEAPKSLVIVPWKSSEMGDDITLSDSLDDRAKPVDKDVFLRELHYYEIRSGH